VEKVINNISLTVSYSRVNLENFRAILNERGKKIPNDMTKILMFASITVIPSTTESRNR
jgi:hypothetical protein